MVWLTLLCAACFLAGISVLMLGPLLVALANTFQTSVAIVGQLAAATAMTWGITAPLAGPVADAYGRRSVLLLGILLLGVGLLGSAVAGTYTSQLLLRLLTGVGAALVPPNTLAMIADVFPPTARGKAIGWVISTSGISAAGGVPLVAYLVDAGGWRLPFAVIGLVSLGVWLLAGVWLPRRVQPSGPAHTFFAHYREVGLAGEVFVCARGQYAAANRLFWHVWLPGGLSDAARPSARERSRVPPCPRGGGGDPGRLPRRTGGRPSPSCDVAHRVLVEQRRPRRHGLHHGGLPLGDRDARLWHGRPVPHRLCRHSDVITRDGGALADHSDWLVRHQQPTGDLRTMGRLLATGDLCLHIGASLRRVGRDEPINDGGDFQAP